MNRQRSHNQACNQTTPPTTPSIQHCDHSNNYFDDVDSFQHSTPKLSQHIRNEVILQILNAGGIENTNYQHLKSSHQVYYNNLSSSDRKKISDKLTYWKKNPSRFTIDTRTCGNTSSASLKQTPPSNRCEKMTFNINNNRDYYSQFIPQGFDLNRIGTCM